MEFVPIRSFDSYVTANIWLGKLQDAGFHCYLKDEYTVTIDPILSNAVGGIKLCVNGNQLEECISLIKSFELQSREVQRCPVCASDNVQFITQSNPVNWVSAVVTWLFGSYALGAKQVYHCFDCGKEFDEIKNEELNSLANS